MKQDPATVIASGAGRCDECGRTRSRGVKAEYHPAAKGSVNRRSIGIEGTIVSSSIGIQDDLSTSRLGRLATVRDKCPITSA